MSAGRIPELDGVVATSRNQGAAIGAEGYGVDRIRVACEGAQRMHIGRILHSSPILSQSLMVWSRLPETRVRPLGLKATELTESEWPVRVRSGCTLAESFILLRSYPRA